MSAQSVCQGLVRDDLQNNYFRWHPKSNRKNTRADAGRDEQVVAVFKNMTGGVLAEL